MEDQAQDLLGFGLSPGFKFQPDDDELVEHFLLRRILGQQLPLEGIIIEDDPLSAPPWELLDKHERKDNEAFFFANGQPIDDGNSGRQRRTCIGGGCWKGEKTIVDGDRLRVADGGMEIAWKKYMLSFHPEGKKEGSTGWVMHEYSITAPEDLASSSLMRLYSIRFSGHGEHAKREPDDYAQAKAERHLLEAHSAAANSADFPTAATVDPLDYDHGGGSARPVAPSYSDQDYQYTMNLVEDYGVASSSHQDFVGGNTTNLGAPGVTNAAAPAGMLAPYMDQGSSFSGAIDDFSIDELLGFLDCGPEAPPHDQYSSAGMETQSYMQLS